jgi:DNA-binding NarL/FixJ family response regulator
MGGEEAFRALQSIKPDVVVVLMSGFNEQDAIDRFVGRGIAGFLAKPFNSEMLVSKLRAVFAKK